MSLSLAGHLVTTISFLGIGTYSLVNRSRLRRTTTHSNLILWLAVAISVLFSAINLYRMIVEISGTGETVFAHEMDTVGHFSGILAQTVLIVILISSKISTGFKSNPDRVLAIGAHPDDLELAAGGTLSKMHDAGYQVTGLVLTKGERGGNGSERWMDANRGAKFLGLDAVRVEDFSDTHLSEHSTELLAVIEAAIADVKPTVIFTHSRHDLHQDHQAVFDATMRAARFSPITVLCYESPSATEDFHPNYFIDVRQYVDVKIEAIRKHYDQRKKKYMDPDHIRGILSFRGNQAKVNFAEGFEVARMISTL